MLEKMKAKVVQSASGQDLKTQEASKRMERMSVQNTSGEREELMIRDRSQVVGSGSVASLPSDSEEVVLRNPTAHMDYQAGFHRFLAQVGGSIAHILLTLWYLPT